jgi:uncharacterized delta-60 repeat protein
VRILGGILALSLLAVPQEAGAAGTVPLGSFGDSGRVATALGGHPQADTSRATVVQPDGRVVVAGTSDGRLAIARYALDGSLDPEFGGGQGFTTSEPGRPVGVHAVTLDSEGRIVVAGSLGDSHELQDVFVARYLGDGTLDPSFGDAGIVVHDLGASETCSDVLVRPSGEVLCGVDARPGHASDFVLIQWTSDGELDPAFGSGGVVTTSWATGSRDLLGGIALGPDGSVVAVGRTDGSPYEDIGVARYLPSGGLDPDFGEGGLVKVSFGESDFARDAVVRPDGRIVVLGGTSPTVDSFMFVGLTADGELDPAFGAGGQAIIAAGDDDEPRSIALQPDGRIVAAGSSRVPENRARFSLVRVLPDGSADPTFGGDGSVMTSVYANPDPVDDEANDVALDTAGRVVLVGYVWRGHFATLRFLPDGSLDPTFDGDGRAFTTIRPYYSVGVSGVLEQADGGVVVAGTYLLRYERAGTRIPYVARYLPDGSLDPGFGDGDGVVTFEPGTDSGLAGLEVAPDGDLIVAGGVALTGGGTGFYVTKLDPDGGLDAAFGDAGTKVVDLGPNVIARGLAVGTDGAVVVAGWSKPETSWHGMALLRLLADGTEDPGFGAGGVVITSSPDRSEAAVDVAFLSDGSIVAAGTLDAFDDHVLADWAVAKFHADGAVDQDFGSGGIVRTNLERDEFSESFDQVGAVAVDDDGQITVVGHSDWNKSPSSRRFALARYTSQGAPVARFGGDGVVVTELRAGGGHFSDVVTDGPGVIVAGTLSRLGGRDDFALARYTENGVLDTGFAQGGMLTTDFFGDDDYGGALSLGPNGTATVAGSIGDGAGSALLGVARYALGYDAPPPEGPPPPDPPGEGDDAGPGLKPPASNGAPPAEGGRKRRGNSCKPTRSARRGKCVKRTKKRKRR